MMTFNSYSQNFEDVMLWRALKGVKAGFYIDVGAADPRLDSVTAGFYECGWRGINIEPQNAYFVALEKARPRDVNLCMMVGANVGERSFYTVSKAGVTGLSTNVEAIADRHAAEGFDIVESRMAVSSLAEICRQYVTGEAHFLKIDVEGAEADVLASMDFTAFRPWIVLVEATVPNTTIASHAEWEDILTRAGYEFVWFDGLNRFYVSAEKFEALAPHFKLPPNVFDGFVRPGPAEVPKHLVAEPDGFIAAAPGEMTPEARTVMTASCRDADAIPKVPGAGAVVEEADGARVQVMHNGLKVVADGYCGPWMTRLIELCRGHHEPQEERVFHEVASRLGAEATMIELGGNWSYYSLWFLQGAPGRRAIVVEPDPENRAVGEANARLNKLSVDFIPAFVGPTASNPTPFRTERSGIVSIPCVTVPELMRLKGIDRLDILHCDTQGAELDVLESCEALLREGRIAWIFVSTHAHGITGDPLTHQRCLAVLRRCGAFIEAEHDVHESFSGDGLIVARFAPAPLGWQPVRLSLNRYATSLFRNPIYDLAGELGRKGQLTREQIASVVEHVYRAVLLREAEPWGLAAHIDALVAKTLNVQTMIEGMFGSLEFKQRQAEFAVRYFGDPPERTDPYLGDNGRLECTGFRFRLKADGALGVAGESLLVPRDHVILPSVFQQGGWQSAHLDFARKTLDAGRPYTLVDVGANIGLFSRQFLTAFPKIGTCLCVEPDPDNFAALNYNLGKFSDRDIRYFNVALGAADETASFYRDLGNFGNYSLNVDAMRGRSFETRQVHSVDTAAWASEHLHSIGDLILKTDTQGNDESIVTRLPYEVWGRVAFACIEIWRIEKPPFDTARFRALIEAFPHRSFNDVEDGDIDAILTYAAGTDWEHQDLFLWR